MHNIIQDVRYAARNLRRNPGFTAVVVAVLALGIGANTAMFTVVNGVLLRPLPFPEAERLFLVSYVAQHGPFASQMPPSLADRHYLEFRRDDRLFERLATFTSMIANLTGGGEPVRVLNAQVTLDFFAVLRVNPAIGRTFAAGEDQAGRDQVVLLSDKLWRTRFGADLGILGKAIQLDGMSYTVLGVMPQGFRFPYEDDAEVWTPFAVRVDPRNSFMRQVAGRLKPGVSQAQAQAELEAFAARFSVFPGEDRSDYAARVIPLKDLLVANVRKSLWIFAGAVGFVLLIACANVANLLLARAAGRQQEMAVRTALGAGRWRLMRQLLTESALVSLAGGAAGLLLALWGVPLFLALAGDNVPRAELIQVDGGVLVFTLGLSLATGMVFGFVPALQATRRELRGRLSQAGRTVTGRHERLRGALVITEIALALVLLTGAGLLLKSFLRMRAVHLGFHPENVLAMTVDLPTALYQTAPQLNAFHERTLARLARVPGVTATAAVNYRPLGGLLMMGDFTLEGGRPLPPDYMVDKPCVSPGYFRAMGIRLLRGREFTASDTAAAPGVVIVSQSVARRIWPGEDPVGKRIAFEDHPKAEDWRTVAGVVDDVRQRSLRENLDPAIYQPIQQVTHPFFLSHMTFVVRTAANPAAVAPAIRGVLREIDKDQPIQTLAPMQELIAETTAEPRFQTRLLGTFSLLALVLSAVGIYGVLAYAVTQRTHEIGIRMALGAESRNVLGMVLHRTLALAGAGILLGTAGALALTRVLAKFLFAVKPTDPATFVVVAALLTSVALLAGWIPARRASRVDPAEALRYE